MIELIKIRYIKLNIYLKSDYLQANNNQLRSDSIKKNNYNSKPEDKRDRDRELQRERDQQFKGYSSNINTNNMKNNNSATNLQNPTFVQQKALSNSNSLKTLKKYFLFIIPH